MGQLKKIKNIHFAGTVDANHLPPGHHSWMPGVTVPDRFDEDGDDHHDDYHYECEYHNDHNVMMIITRKMSLR